MMIVSQCGDEDSIQSGNMLTPSSEKPSLKASALALQCYQLTEELSRSHVKEYTEKIKSFIKGHVTGDKVGLRSGHHGRNFYHLFGRPSIFVG
jgi:hypothetical protein